MAIRQLMLSKKIEQRKANLAELLTQEEAFKTRSAELEKALEEAKTDEEIAAVEEEVNKLEGEQSEFDEKKGKLEGEIADLEGELEQLNSNEPKNDPKPNEPKVNERSKGDVNNMKIRGKFFAGMTREAATQLIEREEVKEFLARTREVMAEKRSVTGGELGIPEVFLEILRDNLNSYSKLISKVNLRSIAGKARQNVAGTIPEGIWTEAYGKINELSITFNQIEVDGYKVGGFIAIPNALLEDSDLGLASEIMYNIGQAIGLAIDKAILYGTGTKMPVGIVKRLAETSKPAYWGDNEKAWTDLHTSNLLLIDPTANTDTLFYKDLILKCGKAKANYSNGQKFWCMNTNTKATLTAKALTINAAGAIVTGQSNTMPIVGGDIIELDFIPDDVIIGGYGSLYLMVERAGATMAQSTDVKFIEDQTVFKGTARYDGRPVIGEGFVAINISQETGATVPSATAVTFAADTANA
ncbi:phage major capsid protein [Clostridium butyricum]|uniref:phage major capsid protein n=1 Tax=Clostridium butyricum TaxID=1492 RepID=UPI00129B4344|nr:phage major capsid protein [Clostridium butyricum]MDB2158342.1 phage major capsid protein [Clostridium butyricum]QGH23243.1 phage major capsid protein [Clostridium butyricum]QGH27286.1 phage major capsid protein [Clostridium butyricum]